MGAAGFILILSVVAGTVLAAPREAASAGFQGVFTYHNDNARTGQNLAETILTPANVNSASFGKLFSYPVDGYIYGQPLYVPGVKIRHQGVHNVVYVVTEHDSVYAFDADGLASTPLWHRSFIKPRRGLTTVPASDAGSEVIGPEIGITGTPVIDPVSHTLYVVAETKHRGKYAQRLHALSLATGAEKFGGPVRITASVRGKGDGANKRGVIRFNALRQLDRSALLLAGGAVYIAFASNSDVNPYHGWVFAYKARGLKRAAIFNDTPDGSQGGIWQGGNGPASDSSGAVFVASGNGTFDADQGGRDLGDSVLKLTRTRSKLSMADYFTPYNQEILNEADRDMGSAGPLLLPDQSSGPPHLAVVGDKQGVIYLLDRDSLGHYNPAGDAQVVQEVQAVGSMFSSPAYYNGRIYFNTTGGPIFSCPLVNGQLDAAGAIYASPAFGFPGAVPAVSANGAGDAIVWAIETAAYAGGGPAVLYAYDAPSLNELYDSTQAGSRDTAGPAVKFTVPTVANGKVYVGTQTELDVYGLLGQ
jgi:hypothetical protein